MGDNEVKATTSKMAKVLVVDTAGFIKNVSFDRYAHRVVTLEDVVEEIRDRETRQRLKANPLDIEYLQPDDDSVIKIIDFARKTGDYGSISMTDTKVMALALMLDVQLKGGSSSHLKTEPQIKKTVNFYTPQKDISKSVASNIAGFYISEDTEEDSNKKADEHQGESDKNETTEEVTVKEEVEDKTLADENEASPASAHDDENGDENDDGGEWIVASNKKKSAVVVEIEEEEEDDEDEEYSDDDFEDDDDDEGWITPANIQAKKKVMGLEHETPEEPEVVDVACMTSDFAMQNVLVQMGLKVASPYGCGLIRETKTWILRCHGCFATTPEVTKKFCPNCGHATLKRVSVTLNADGSQQIHINAKKTLSTRGKRFSLPTPKGGKHAVNPILTADQLMPKHQVTKVARTKTNAMDPDYVIGKDDPFAKNDVTSKSAMMGIGHKSRPYWDYKNPNAVRNKTGNKRKKRQL